MYVCDKPWCVRVCATIAKKKNTTITLPTPNFSSHNAIALVISSSFSARVCVCVCARVCACACPQSLSHAHTVPPLQPSQKSSRNKQSLLTRRSALFDLNFVEVDPPILAVEGLKHLGRKEGYGGFIIRVFVGFSGAKRRILCIVKLTKKSSNPLHKRKERPSQAPIASRGCGTR